MATLPPILVVDDSEDDLHLIKRLLARARVRNPVVTFSDVDAAIAFLKASAASAAPGLTPCLVFTDLKMPGLDGFDFIKWIREQKAYARMPVVMLSGSDHEKDLKRAKALGVTKYYVKLPTADVMAKIMASLLP